MDRDKNTVSETGAFRLNGKFYQHVLYIADDDRVECQDDKKNMVLTFTADSYVFDKNKTQIGRCRMKFRTDEWVFVQEGDDTEIDMGRDLLRGEVEIAKMYLEGKLNFKPA